ncbi:hypothetical protein [Azospirillum sp.]|uniref:hypothetical protein n=1 Tax=Azospirillum sp. TaxID=34012 RepID=UPI003D72759F
MRALVLKDLPYSADGVRIVTLPAGQEADIRDDLAPGLIAAGYIADASQPLQDKPDSASATDVADDHPEPAKRGPGRPRKG